MFYGSRLSLKDGGKPTLAGTLDKWSAEFYELPVAGNRNVWLMKFRACLRLWERAFAGGEPAVEMSHLTFSDLA